MELSFWLNANKIALQLAKTKVLLFKIQYKQNSSFVENSYIFLDLWQSINWKDRVNEIASKLRRDNVIIAKLRYYVKKETLQSIYFTIFHSIMIYSCIVWGRSKNFQNGISALQKKALITMNFTSFNGHTNPKFLDSIVSKLTYLINI